MNTKSILLLSILSFLSYFSIAQNQERSDKNLNCSKISTAIILDGYLIESDWLKTDSISELSMIEPSVGNKSSQRTVVRVLADEHFVYIGVKCYDDDSKGIVSYSKAKDSELDQEDYIKLVFDTYQDGRTGFVFAVNPNGARYDAIVSGRGEYENSNWDVIWETKTSRSEMGWMAEIKIPVKSLTFKKGLTSWGFNIERRIQRLMEIDRWSGISIDYNLTHTIHAGTLINLPKFNLGIGLIAKGSALGKVFKERGAKPDYAGDFSLDITEKFTSDITGQLTINTDFAEAEVDERQTNLTRFPLFFPEKRQFFLEGSDIFDFGVGSDDAIPFFSRSIGLYNGREVPLNVGGKLTGKLNKTNFGALITQTGKVDTLVPQSTMGVVRVKQNILEESSIGFLGTTGDPLGRNNCYTLGADFIYQTSKLFGDKNFVVGTWGLYTDRDSLTGDKSTLGFKIDYPNDLVDAMFMYNRIGDGFDPSLGFVPRQSIKSYMTAFNYMPRPKIKHIRQLFFETFLVYITDLKNKWENYEVYFTPVNVLFESGDQLKFEFVQSGEILPEAFEVVDNVEIQPNEYHSFKSEVEIETASKRMLSGSVEYKYGGFYTGKLHQIEVGAKLRPSPNLILEVGYEKNIGKLPEGNFTQDLVAGRIQLNFTTDIQLSSFIQYDNESESIGTNTRLRWTFAPKGDLFVVYNHNMGRSLTDRFSYESNQFVIKLTYGLWM